MSAPNPPDYPVSFGTASIGPTCSILFLGVHRKQVYALWSWSLTLSPFWMSFLQLETDWNHFRSGRQEFTMQRGLQLRQNLWSSDNISPLSALAFPSSFPFCSPSLLGPPPLPEPFSTRTFLINNDFRGARLAEGQSGHRLPQRDGSTRVLEPPAWLCIPANIIGSVCRWEAGEGLYARCLTTLVVGCSHRRVGSQGDGMNLNSGFLCNDWVGANAIYMYLFLREKLKYLGVWVFFCTNARVCVLSVFVRTHHATGHGVMHLLGVCVRVCVHVAV